ncbi:DUF6266 family protein [Desertivirga brevis]|uniref:DUF6266 family protein n=1 Tax=Desertivirga brevis TaxID=2810310 RepID=UPI001A96C538|nr:DUF6266 family protein [Pedobacter sp. SYSU D00873]
MAKLPNGVLGNFYGKVGNIVGYTHKGQQCIRQASRKTTKAPTEAQLAQRARFSLVGRFLKPINQFLNSLPKKSKNAQARSSTAMAQVQRAMVEDGETPRIDYPEVVLCEGYGGIFDAELTPCPGGFSFRYTIPRWTRLMIEGIHVLVYLPEYEDWVIEEARFDGEQVAGTVILEDFMGQTSAEVFAIGKYCRGTKVTNSVYSGSVLITASTNPE